MKGASVFVWCMAAVAFLGAGAVGATSEPVEKKMEAAALRLKKEQWVAGQKKVREVQLRATVPGKSDYDISQWKHENFPAYVRALEELIPLAPTVEERCRLQLLCGDIMMVFLKDAGDWERGQELWRQVAGTEEAPPYFRFLAMDKLAGSILYRRPLPNHLAGSFPERRPVTREQVNEDKLDVALGWWQRVGSLNLKAWVKLDALVGMARAYQSCGRPAEGVVILRDQALVLSDLTRRQAAEIRYIMAELAMEAGDRKQARTLCREVARTPDIRPQLVEMAKKLGSKK